MEKENALLPTAAHKVPFSQKIYLGIASTGANIINTVVYGAILKYYTDVVGLDPRLYGIAFLIFGIWNAIDDPVFGYISDTTIPHPRFGKRLLWMRRAIPMYILGFLLLWIPSPEWGEIMIFLFLLVILFAYDTSFTIYVLNQCALSTTITDDPSERASISLVTTLVGALPGEVAIFVPILIFTSFLSQSFMFLIFSGVGVVGIVLMILGTLKLREPTVLYVSEPPFRFFEALKATVHSRAFICFVIYSFAMGGCALSLNSTFVYFIDNVLEISGFEALLPSLLTGVIQLALYFVVIRLNKRLTVRNTLLIYIVVAIIGYIGLFFATHYYLIIFYFGCCMWAGAAHWLLLSTIVGDIADEDELKTHQRREGMFYGINALVAYPAQSFIVFLFTQIIAHFGYDGTLEHQSSQAIFGIRLGISFTPICFLVIGLIAILLYPLQGQRYREMKEQIRVIYEKKQVF